MIVVDLILNVSNNMWLFKIYDFLSKFVTSKIAIEEKNTDNPVGLYSFIYLVFNTYNNMY